MEVKIVILGILSLLCCGGAIFIYNKKEKLESNRRFAIYLTVLGLIFVQTLLPSIFGTENAHPILVFCSLMFFVLSLLLPPSMYLYVVSLVKGEESEKILNNSGKHYYPAVALLIINIFSFIALYNIEPDTQNYTLLDNIRTYANLLALAFVFLVQNVFYIYFSFKLFLKRKVVLKMTQDININKTLQWMLMFIISFAIVIFMIYFSQLLSPSGKIIMRIALLIYVVFLLFFGNRNKEFNTENAKDDKLDIEKRNEISKNLVALMKNEKPYLKNTLNIHSLSQELNTNTKYLSYVINEEFDKNFNSFINHYRIEESKELLLDPDNHKYTIETIANMTGFKSKSSFNASFKKFTDTTPSKFRNLNLKS